MNIFKVKKTIVVMACALAALVATPLNAKLDDNKPLRTRYIDFKTIVEKSKTGKREQNSFEALKRQMETVLEEKENKLNDMIGKLEDINYLDSISPEAERKLKRDRIALTEEYAQQKNQYLQALNEANFTIVQKLDKLINDAAKKVAEEQQIDLIVKDACYYNPSLDVSDKIIAMMDQQYEKEALATK